MARVRSAFQGVGNIVRFNWHFYVGAAAAGAAAVGLGALLGGPLARYAYAVAAAVAATTLGSLLVSYYVYDASDLYTLRWLNADALPPGGHVVNVHAGFDETSALLACRYPGATLTVLDFYDPAQHTEVSIRRARAAYPPYPGTQPVQPPRLPLPAASADRVFVCMAAHEIRQPAQRVAFFREVRRLLRPGGRVVVVEHLRDAANFAAYTVGFLHFYSRRTWLGAFGQAGLAVVEEQKITPFVSAFTLAAGGSAS